MEITYFSNGGYTHTVTRLLPNGVHTRTVTTFLPGGGFGGVPASGEAIARLKRQKHGDDDAVSGQAKRRQRQRGTGDESTTDEEAAAAAAQVACAICLEDFEAGDGLAVKPCAHRFHEGCLTEWLALSRLCPCCRHALPSEGEGKAPRVAMSMATTSVAEGGGAGLRIRRRHNRGFQGSRAVEQRGGGTGKQRRGGADGPANRMCVCLGLNGPPIPVTMDSAYSNK